MFKDINEHFDDKSSRKALLAVALTTVFVSNLSISDNTLAIIGLEFVIDQSKLISIGKLSTLILLLVFLFRASPKLVANLVDTRFRRLEAIQHLKTEELSASFGWRETLPPTDPQEELEQLRDGFTYRRAEIQRQAGVFQFVLNFAAYLAVDFMLPCAVAYVAIFYPEAVLIFDAEIRP